MRLTVAITLALTLAASPALAKDKPFKKNKARGVSAAASCPPGLAKKSPACVPPGQAKKRYGLKRGDRYDGNGRILRDYGRYGLPRLDPGESYYRLGDTIIAVNDDTRLILDVLGVISRVSN